MRPVPAFLLSSLLAAALAGITTAAQAGGTTGQVTNDFTTKADLWHAALSGRIVSTVDRVDRFFGDDRLLEDNRDTTIRIGLGPSWNEADGLSLKTRFNARLSLPRLEQKLQLIADNFTDADDPLHGSSVGQSIRDSSPDAGVRYVVKDEGPVRFTGDAGLRLGSDPQVFGKMRARLVVPFDPWEMRLSQTVQWYSHDGFGETTELRWSRLMSRGWIFQSGTRLAWREDRNGVTPSQFLTWQRAAGTTWGHRISIDAEWPETPHTTEAAYVLSYGYRRLIHRNWLFLEVVPGVDFSEVRDYEINPRIAVLFEVLLGEFH